MRKTSSGHRDQVLLAGLNLLTRRQGDPSARSQRIRVADSVDALQEYVGAMGPHSVQFSGPGSSMGVETMRKLGPASLVRMKNTSPMGSTSYSRPLSRDEPRAARGPGCRSRGREPRRSSAGRVENQKPVVARPIHGRRNTVIRLFEDEFVALGVGARSRGRELTIDAIGATRLVLKRVKEIALGTPLQPVGGHRDSQIHRVTGGEGLDEDPESFITAVVTTK